MSENGTPAGTPAPTAAGTRAGPQFTEREMTILSYAWRSLKSGPPEIDYEKLAGFVGMSNPRSASNAWANIKKKLMADNPDAGAPAKPTKKAQAGTPRKKTSKKADSDSNGEANDNGDVPATPRKTPRKRASKKQEVEGEESSPKKKGRAAKTKKEVSDDDKVMDDDSGDAEVKEETNGEDDDEVKAEAVDEDVV